MATVQRPATPSFRAVNSVDFAPTEVSARNMATPRSRLTPPAPPAASTSATATTTTTSTATPYDLRSQTTPATVQDGSTSPSRMSSALDEDDAGDHDGDRDSLEPAEKSGGSGKSSGRAKKKKGTKFHCTGFGSCNLAFTRSEHLARHIRKHTGERPFMCHCGRWFSRLDNLRQHSSTVHADEEIPSNSLAATGTRYQRHGRPERVRPRSRAQSQSDIQPPTEQQLQPTPPAALGSPMEDRRTRRRPDPIVVPQDAARDESAFNQYRDHTPPDSPASSVSTFRFGGGGVYRNRAAPYPAVAESPAATPTSSRIGSNSDSPFGSPGGYSHRGSVAYDGTSSSVAARRLSMPHPPTPSLFAAPPQVLPHLGYAGPAAAPASRRDSLTSVIADDRRRTWHMGTPVSVNFQRDIVSPTTQSFARTTIHSPTEPGHPPMPHSRPAHTDRLPSIHHVLQEFAPSTPEHQRSSWAGDTLERPGTSELKRPFHEGISAVSGRRVAPGQVRSSHGRSISNIETKGWGGGQSNPFSLGPWGGDTRDRREASLQPNTSLSVEGNNRHSGYFGGALSNIPSPREHRHSFGSSDSNVSEGLVTPVAPLRTQPRILGEPGDAVFHTEGPDKDYERSCEMTGVETTGQPPSTCNELMNAGNMEGHTTVPSNFPVSRLDALVSAAAVAAKI